MKLIAKFVFWLWGWKVQENIPRHIKKCVIVMAQHTSNWDYVMGKLAGYIFDVNPKVLIKKSLFFFPLGLLLNKLGAVPVNRGKSSNLVKDLAEDFEKHDEFMVLFTPEGTRSYNPKWKKGFYFVAKAANVPVVPVYIDYERKKIGFTTEFEISEDADKDIEKLKTYFKQFKGKFPENGIR